MEPNDTESLSSTPLPAPAELYGEFPLPPAARQGVEAARAEIRAIVQGGDSRLLVVVGPCSIHDPVAALEYAQRLAHARAQHGDALFLCMRAYFEKPRTTTGWKGLLNDPTLDGRCDVTLGLRTARRLLVALAELELPAASEALDPLAQRYLSDTISWTAIGARTTESQTHRELASGLTMPVGFKNGTDGSLTVALNAMRAAARPHSFLGLDSRGRVAALRTRGNPHTHVVLRGGRLGPNYAAPHVSAAADALRTAGLPARIMIDISHDNSERDHRNQVRAADAVAEQLEAGSFAIMGVMVESHLVEGRQDLKPGVPLRYGQSITDACVDFGTTERMLERLADAVRIRRRKLQRERRVTSEETTAAAVSCGEANL